MKNKQNRNITTWNKALKHFDRKRIRQMRKELGFNEYGFKKLNEFKDWQRRVKFFMDDDNLSDDEIEKTIAYRTILFRHEISKMSPYVESGFENAIREYFFFDVASEESIISANGTGCRLELVMNNEDKLAPGLYVRIGDQSSNTDIKDFIKNNSSHISDFLNIYRNKKGIKKLKNPKIEDFEKNEIIHNFNTYPIALLKKLSLITGVYKEESEIPRRRDILATALMKKMGYDIQPENFKVIAQREKEEREKYKK